MIKYQRCIGTVEYSPDDRVYYGQIENIEGIVTYESDTEPGLKQSFAEVVQDYLLFCAENRINPAVQTVLNSVQH